MLREVSQHLLHETTKGAVIPGRNQVRESFLSSSIPTVREFLSENHPSKGFQGYVKGKGYRYLSTYEELSSFQGYCGERVNYCPIISSLDETITSGWELFA
jgi:hypothetical protein